MFQGKIFALCFPFNLWIWEFDWKRIHFNAFRVVSSVDNDARKSWSFKFEVVEAYSNKLI